MQRVHCDQCQFGASVKHGKLKGEPVKKPTGFMTNASEVANALEASAPAEEERVHAQPVGRMPYAPDGRREIHKYIPESYAAHCSRVSGTSSVQRVRLRVDVSEFK